MTHELRQRGWGEAQSIKQLSKADLLANWKQILFEKIRGINRINNSAMFTNSEQSSCLPGKHTLH